MKDDEELMTLNSNIAIWVLYSTENTSCYI